MCASERSGSLLAPRFTKRECWKRRNLFMSSKNQISTQLSRSAACAGPRLWGARIVALLLLLLMCASGSFAYSVLTHEQIVVLVWTDELSPLLLQRFPALPEEQSKDANEYAFALGALAHYASAIAGHPAVNQAVSIQYP